MCVKLNDYFILLSIILTSGQRILMKGRIARGPYFSWGQCNVTLTSQEHCSRRQQSCCHAVIEE